MSVILKKKGTPEPEPEMPEKTKTPEKSKTPEPIFIGTDLEIGKGTYKTVYSCQITNSNNAIFQLPKGTDETNLCIAVVDIINIMQTNYGNNEKFITLIKQYIVQSAEERRENKYKDVFKTTIREEVRRIEQEIELQKKLFQKQLAPQIYEYKIHGKTLKMYILEEKCGLSLVNYIRMYSNKVVGVPETQNGRYNYKGTILLNLPYTDEDVFNKIVNLTQNIADAGYMNTDIKPENTCTKIRQDNNLLEDIIALDFDPHFFININLSLDKENLLKNAKIFMLTLFIAYLGKRKNIKFVEEIVEKHLTRTKISDMITFFANYQLICLRDRHPLYMLYHYIIGLRTDSLTSCIDNKSPEKINYLTNEICKYIFFGVGDGRGKKTKGSKRIKVSKRTKRSKK